MMSQNKRTAPEEDKQQHDTELEQKTVSTKGHDELGTDVGASKRKRTERVATYMPRVRRKRLNREVVKFSFNSRGQLDTKQAATTGTKEQHEHTA